MPSLQAETLERICAYCEYATLLAGTDACVCRKRGVVRADGHCRRYRPDLLKVQPRLPRLPEDPNEAPVEFSLEP